MEAIAGFVRVVYAVTRVIGRIAAWLILATVLICAFVALARYFFSFGRIWIQELYIVAFALSFMLIAAYAYQTNAHVRVDIFSRKWPPERQALVELLGAIVFMIPWLLLVLWSSWPFVKLSWQVLEPSSQAGGLSGIYLVKSVIPFFAVLMLLQALAAIGRSVLIMNGRTDLLPAEEASGLGSGHN